MKFEVKRKRARIEITSMIDVMFFTLIFFMLFSTFKEAQIGMEVDLPQTSNVGRVQENLVVISINKNAQIYFGKKRVNLADLGRLVRAELEDNASSRFIVNPDAAVSYQKLIEVTDVLAGQGVTKPLWGVDRRQMPNSIE